ncbi:MAG TPA: trimethylamine methyltransferase family protein [Desulfosporosinus sp.]|nr:trimethylamine methyltransferase family protein [Desulfosporosinus sp.]
MRTNIKSQTSLGLNILTPDQCDEIHFATLEVLDRVGVNVFDEEALNLLRERGANVDGRRVRIPAWMVQEALVTAPCRIAIGNRNGNRAMFLEKGRSYYGSGSDTPYTVDIYSGERRFAVKQDVVNFSRISDNLKHIDFVMSMALASDVPRKDSYLHQFEAMVLNTTKPILYTAGNYADLVDIIKMAEIIAGSPEALQANPFLILYDEPSSPLQHSQEALQKLMLMAEKRLPVIYIPAVMMGATGPVTAAGALVVANCESLSGLVIHQLKAKGAPFIYGGGVPPMDMKTQICSYGAPEEHQNCAALITMASQYYNLPVFTTAGCSDAVEFDQQAGMEAGFNLLSSSLAGGNLIHDLGYIGAGMISSLEMLALCNEAVGMVKHFVKGIEINPETLAIDVIEKVGPGGNFFAEEHTFNNFKKHLHFPELMNRYSYDKWKEAGATTFAQRANEKVRHILENHQPQELSKDVIEKVKEIIARRDS